MEQEGNYGENDPDISSAQKMIEQVFKDEEDRKWVDEVSAKLRNPDEFLEMVKSDPRCEIIRKLSFDVNEGDEVLESRIARSLRPAGKVTIINGKKYVGGWQVDELGFYAAPQTESKEVFNRLKTLWISENIFGARRIGENEEEYQQRRSELHQRVDQYHRDQEENIQE